MSGETEPDFHNSVRLLPHVVFLVGVVSVLLFSIYFTFSRIDRLLVSEVVRNVAVGWIVLRLLGIQSIEYGSTGLRLIGIFGVRIVSASQISDYYADERTGLIILSSGKKIRINYKIYSSASVAEFETFIYGLIGRTLDSYPDEDDVEFFNEHLHRPLQSEELPSGKKLGR